MAIELTFLGTGTSAGVPMIGCSCEVCLSQDPRNQRHRSSVLIRYERPAGTREPGPVQFLVDAAPELRLQMLRERIERIDGVLFTHAHADHIFGIDDLRRFNAVMERELDLYAEDRVATQLREMFGYAFRSDINVNGSFVPQLLLRRVEPGVRIELLGAGWTPVRLLHGRLPILGFRVDRAGASMAYCTDVSAIPPESYPLLEGLDVLVIDALRYRHHPTHLTVDQALEAIEQLAPARSYLTHVSHEIDHGVLQAALPPGVFVAYDGLRVVASQRSEAARG